MNFLKKFFKEDDTIIGLCGFDNMKPNYCKKPIMSDNFFNAFELEKVFETCYDKNILLL